MVWRAKAKGCRVVRVVCVGFAQPPTDTLTHTAHALLVEASAEGQV